MFQIQEFTQESSENGGDYGKSDVKNKGDVTKVIGK